jgi:hypothetical protein
MSRLQQVVILPFPILRSWGLGETAPPVSFSRRSGFFYRKYYVVDHIQHIKQLYRYTVRLLAITNLQGNVAHNPNIESASLYMTKVA